MVHRPVIQAHLGRGQTCPGLRDEVVPRLTPASALQLDCQDPAVALPSQHLPQGRWRPWLWLAQAGSADNKLGLLSSSGRAGLRDVEESLQTVLQL